MRIRTPKLVAQVFLSVCLSLSACSKLPSTSTCVHHEHIIKLWPTTLSAEILHVQPGPKCQIDLEMAYGNSSGLESVASIAKRRGAVAAINGGFFLKKAQETMPVHVLKKGEKWYSDPFYHRAAFGFSQGGQKLLIDNLGMRWELVIAGEHFPIKRVNKPRSYKNTILYTPSFKRRLDFTSDGIQVVVDKGYVEEILYGRESLDVPKTGFVYSAGSESGIDLSMVQPGDQAGVHYLFQPKGKEGAWEEMEHILGGTPLLLYNGVIPASFEAEKVEKRFIEGRHARTALGFREDGTLIFVVVDGGNPFHSLGMSIPELARFMQSLGCKSAINLDGGSSSTLYFAGKVRNAPLGLRADKNGDGEPLVGDALVVLAN